MNLGGPEPPSSVKLSNQSQGVHLQLQSNVQMISQGVVSRHSNFQTPPIQANWPNPTVKQQPGNFSQSSSFTAFLVLILCFL